MDRTLELSLMDEIRALKTKGSAFLDDAVAQSPVSHYTSESRFKAEQAALFRKLPVVAAHVSELSKPGAFLKKDLGGRSVLVTRDRDNNVHAFLNVCRHRGTQLVEADSGCKHRFSCPYHAWTYSSSGALIGAPHFEEGFPDIDKADFSLHCLQCTERFGFVWVWSSDDIADIETYFEGLSEDLSALGLDTMKIAADDTTVRNANWKILVEGGIEAYHFRVAHKNTIGPHFEDNLSSYQSFGPHMRAVLARTSMAELTDGERSDWRIRDHANVLYTLFPTSQLLVMQDHIAWISSEPLSAFETKLRIVTLAPTSWSRRCWKR